MSSLRDAETPSKEKERGRGDGGAKLPPGDTSPPEEPGESREGRSWWERGGRERGRDKREEEIKERLEPNDAGLNIGSTD